MEAAAAALPQHMSALAKANRVRSQRAEMIREMRAGERSIDELLDHPAFANMRLTDLLVRIPKRKPTSRTWSTSSGTLRSAMRAVQGIGASEALTCGSLTERQRKALRAWLPPWLRG